MDDCYIQRLSAHPLFCFLMCSLFTFAFSIFPSPLPYLSPSPDLSAGPEGARIISGLLRPEEGLQTQESGDHFRSKEGGMPQAGKPPQEGETLAAAARKNENSCSLYSNIAHFQKMRGYTYFITQTVSRWWIAWYKKVKTICQYIFKHHNHTISRLKKYWFYSISESRGLSHPRYLTHSLRRQHDS